MNYLATLRKYWYILLIAVIITCVLTLILTAVQTPKYRSTVRLLIIQKGVEAQTAARSVEVLGNVLSRIIYTSSFMNDVLESGLDIEDTFSRDPEKRELEWRKDLEVETKGAGILEIRTYATSSYQTEQLAFGISYILTSKGKVYHGAENVEIKMIDQPITSKKPVKPNVLFNLIIAFVLGLFLGAVIIYLIELPKLGELKKELPPKRKIELRPPEIKRKVPEMKVPEKKKLEVPTRKIPKRPEVKRERIPERPRKPEPEEAYTPEKVDRWIKTGKFE